MIIQRYPATGSISMVLPTASLYDLVVRAYVRRGYKYFVGWRDVNGFGLHIVRRADWQDDNSTVSHNPWTRS